MKTKIEAIEELCEIANEGFKNIKLYAQEFKEPYIKNESIRVFVNLIKEGTYTELGHFNIPKKEIKTVDYAFAPQFSRALRELLCKVMDERGYTGVVNRLIDEELARLKSYE